MNWSGRGFVVCDLCSDGSSVEGLFTFGCRSDWVSSPPNFSEQGYRRKFIGPRPLSSKSQASQKDNNNSSYIEFGFGSNINARLFSSLLVAPGLYLQS